MEDCHSRLKHPRFWAASWLTNLVTVLGSKHLLLNKQIALFCLFYLDIYTNWYTSLKGIWVGRLTTYSLTCPCNPLAAECLTLNFRRFHQTGQWPLRQKKFSSLWRLDSTCLLCVWSMVTVVLWRSLKCKHSGVCTEGEFDFNHHCYALLHCIALHSHLHSTWCLEGAVTVTQIVCKLPQIRPGILARTKFKAWLNRGSWKKAVSSKAVRISFNFGWVEFIHV